jgi:hypothetical protein
MSNYDMTIYGLSPQYGLTHDLAGFESSGKQR